MDNDQIDKLLHSYISGTITPQESRQLEAWGDESEENRQILDLIEGHSDLGSELSRMYRYDKEQVWRKLVFQGEKNPDSGLPESFLTTGYADFRGMMVVDEE